ncbi:hypothetical protein ACIBM3_32505 [Rhodococcus erythropolis]|uniref:hypothetical protein n=1 Tax=Rhodococcus erythropolis TaxID=1833 RepID=UPI0037A5F328
MLESWPQTYVRARNVCAHHGRLWNAGLGGYPAIPNSPRSSARPRRRGIAPRSIKTSSLNNHRRARKSWKAMSGRRTRSSLNPSTERSMSCPPVNFARQANRRNERAIPWKNHIDRR